MMSYRIAIPILLILAALITVHGLYPDEFLIDSTTVGLLVLMSAVIIAVRFPQVRRYISELNLLGSGVKFRDEVEEAAEQAEAIAERTKGHSGHDRETIEKSDVEVPWPVFVHIPEHLRRLITEDPRLAIVGLGIEVERAVIDLVRGTRLADPLRPVALNQAVELLRRHHRIDAEEEGLLAKLMRLRSLALHGADVSRQDAETFFSTVESLNDFSVGYSLNLSPNPDWELHRLICRFEHCIERMPLKKEPSPSSCGFFGHDCPGGPPQVQECAALGIFDFPGSAYQTNVKGSVSDPQA